MRRKNDLYGGSGGSPEPGVELSTKAVGALVVVTCLLLAGVIVGGIVLQGCTTTAAKYSTANYPNSIILGAFERHGINPEVVAHRVLRTIRIEMALGKYNREQALAYLQEQRAKVSAGAMYNYIGALITEYTAKMFDPSATTASEATLIAFALLAPDMTIMDEPIAVSPQDTAILLDLIDYFIAGVKATPTSKPQAPDATPKVPPNPQ